MDRVYTKHRINCKLIGRPLIVLFTRLFSRLKIFTCDAISSLNPKSCCAASSRFSSFYARHEPVESVEEAGPLQRGRLLNGPLTIFDLRQPQSIRYLLGIQSPSRVLFVRENQQYGVFELVLLQHRRQLLLGDAQTVYIAAVHHENNRVGVGVVAPPVRPDARLSAQVPHLKLNILILQHFHVEANCRDRLNAFFRIVLKAT